MSLEHRLTRGGVFLGTFRESLSPLLPGRPHGGSQATGLSATSPGSSKRSSTVFTLEAVKEPDPASICPGARPSAVLSVPWSVLRGGVGSHQVPGPSPAQRGQLPLLLAMGEGGDGLTCCGGREGPGGQL